MRVTTDRRGGGFKSMIAMVAAAVLLLAACGGEDAGPEAADPEAGDTEEADTGEADTEEADTEEAVEDHGTVTVVLSVPQSLPFLPADLGPQEGAFDSCRVEVDNIIGESATVGRSLAAGEADIAVQAASRAVGEIMQGIPAKLVAGQKNPWSQVLVVSGELYDNGGIQTPDDVRGLEAPEEPYQFGLSSFGSAGHLSVLRLAEFLGWEEGVEYEAIPLGGVNEITAALEAGEIDAFTWSREVAYRMQTRGVGHVIEEIVPEAVGETIFEAMVASDTFIEERPEALRAYMECYFEYVQELKENPDEVRRLALENWETDEETLDLTLERIVEEWNPDGSAMDGELEGLAEDAAFQNDEVDEAPVEEWWRFWGDL